jgi:hypothetical protein
MKWIASYSFNLSISWYFKNVMRPDVRIIWYYLYISHWKKWWCHIQKAMIMPCLAYTHLGRMYFSEQKKFTTGKVSVTSFAAVFATWLNYVLLAYPIVSNFGITKDLDLLICSSFKGRSTTTFFMRIAQHGRMKEQQWSLSFGI